MPQIGERLNDKEGAAFLQPQYYVVRLNLLCFTKHLLRNKGKPTQTEPFKTQECSLAQLWMHDLLMSAFSHCIKDIYKH